MKTNGTIDESSNQKDQQIIKLEEYLGIENRSLNIIFTKQKDASLLSNYFIEKTIYNQSNHDVLVDVDFNSERLVSCSDQDLESKNIQDVGKLIYLVKRNYSIFIVKELESLTSFRIILMRLKSQHEISHVFVNHQNVFPHYLRQLEDGMLYILKELNNLSREFNIRITMILDKEYLNRKKLINKVKSVKEINQYAFNKTDYESVTLLE